MKRQPLAGDLKRLEWLTIVVIALHRASKRRRLNLSAVNGQADICADETSDDVCAAYERIKAYKQGTRLSKCAYQKWIQARHPS